jgi:hypothetical protein
MLYKKLFGLLNVFPSSSFMSSRLQEKFQHSFRKVYLFFVGESWGSYEWKYPEILTPCLSKDSKVRNSQIICYENLTALWFRAFFVDTPRET